jgi:DNA-binding transcriptional ArsR family regulator
MKENMEWQLLGYKEYPFSINPISINTVGLFTGHEKEIGVCRNILKDKNIRLIIEGARGVGTTSFANYLKFSPQNKHHYFTPREEISVESDWNLEALLTAVISTIIRELETVHLDKVKKDKTFLNAKALAYRLSEAYNSFGITAFSFGGSYGKSGSVTQPTFIPSNTLGYHLQDLGKLVVKLGYSSGILIQLNNLDVNVVHSEEHLKYLFNAARDYFQIDNISWFLVGDIGLRSFIAKRVDRLDDIISDEVFIKPPTKILYHELIKKRLEHYKLRKDAEFPFDKDVFDYLYDITSGRLRYIFGVIYALINRLHTGKLIQKVSLDLAKDTISALAKERMQKFDLSRVELETITVLVKLGECSTTNLAKKLNKNRSFISRIITKFLENKMVTIKQDGNIRVYVPSIDAKIAFQG